MSDKEFLKLAYLEAMKSTDTSTQNGAVIVRNGVAVASGANVFPTGVAELPQRLVRPTKYQYVVHAETNAIYDAAKKGEATLDTVMYSPWAACGECAKAIIQAGILKVVVHEQAIAQSHNQWPDAIKLALEMFSEAGVEYVLLNAHFDDEIEVLFNGAIWKP